LSLHCLRFGQRTLAPKLFRSAHPREQLSRINLHGRHGESVVLCPIDSAEMIRFFFKDIVRPIDLSGIARPSAPIAPRPGGHPRSDERTAADALTAFPAIA